MKVLHCSYRYFPDRGGSETYVSSLVRELTGLGIESVIASAGAPPSIHYHEKTKVHRIEGWEHFDEPSSPQTTTFLQNFRQLAWEIRPDIIHFHWQPGRFQDFPDGAASFPCPLVLTFHHPSLLCVRGNLLRFDKDACSGLFSRTFCLPCVAHKLGAPTALGGLLRLLPDALSSGLARGLPEGKLKTALNLGSNLEKRFASTRAFLASFRRIFMLSEWSMQMLQANGIPSKNLVLSRLGTHHPAPGTNPPSVARCQGEPVRCIYVGRLDSVKGMHLLAAAMDQCTDLPLTLDVYGPLEGADPVLLPYIDGNCRCKDSLKFMGLLRDSEVVTTMQKYDFAVVCSQSFETGPYTVIEAFQAGIPVLGTDIGGINEMVVHGENGYLVPLDSLDGWVRALRYAAENPQALKEWSQHAQWPRTMLDVAEQVAGVYQTVINESDDASKMPRA